MSTVNTRAEQRIVLDNISWETYLSLANDTSRKGKRICYDQGVMEITAPGMLHENAGRLLGRMIEMFTFENEIEMSSSASTTFKRDDLERGFEADESYYFANASKVHGKEEIDLAVDPPPDLAIEIDITRSSLGKFSIFGSLGVPEVWRYDGSQLHIYVHVGGEEYQSEDKSFVLADFPVGEAVRLLGCRHELPETQLIREFYEHIRRLG